MNQFVDIAGFSLSSFFVPFWGDDIIQYEWQTFKAPFWNIEDGAWKRRQSVQYFVFPF